LDRELPAEVHCCALLLAPTFPCLATNLARRGIATQRGGWSLVAREPAEGFQGFFGRVRRQLRQVSDETSQWLFVACLGQRPRDANADPWLCIAEKSCNFRSHRDDATGRQGHTGC